MEATTVGFRGDTENPTEKTVLIEIFWDDLTEKAQNDIRKALNLGQDETWRWDVFPFMSSTFEVKA